MIKQTSIILAVFLFVVFGWCVDPIVAGEIDSDLMAIARDFAPDQEISVLVYLNDQVDLEEITAQMDIRSATLQERHETVVLALQNNAESTQGPILDFLTNLKSDGKVKSFEAFWIVNAFRVKMPAGDIQLLAQHEDVYKVYYDYEIELIEPVAKRKSDDDMITVENGVIAVNAPQCWAMEITGAGVLVANMDTGVDGSHPAVASRWAGTADPRYANNPEWAWYDPRGVWTTPNDGNGHGTHTMGTICGGAPGDEIGVAPGAHWIASAPIDRVDIPTTVADAILSFQWMVDPDGNPGTVWDVPAVCSNSWGVTTGHGYPPCDQTFWSYLDACEAAGTVIVFSAGNEGSSGLRRPADRATDDYRTCAVAAVDAHTSGWPIASFSSRGPTYCTPTGNAAIKPDIAAPGVQVRSSIPGGGYASWDGTSMASPHVNGVVALIRQANPNLSVNEIKQVIYDTAVDLGTSGEDNSYGWGMIDAYAAVLLVSGNNGHAQGYVYESSGNTPIPATIEVVGTGTTGYADNNGFYSILLPADTYTLRAMYNDYVIDEAVVVVPIDGIVSQDFYLDPPNIAVDPASYNISGGSGEIIVQDLNISNSGLGGLRFTLAAQTTNRLGDDPDNDNIALSERQPIGTQHNPDGKFDDKEAPLYPPIIAGQGGPDTFGHKWIDSDQGGGPPVSWIDISGTGTPHYLGDDNFDGPIDIGFNFQYYENTYSQLYIGSNGIISFGSGVSAYSNTGIPNPSTPNDFISVLWDDLYPAGGGVVYHYFDSVNGRFIVSWNGVPFYPGSGSVNVQAVLYPNGNMELNYGTLDGSSHGLESATIGIENIDGYDGLEVVYNAPYLHSNMSIRIYNSWLSASPASGTVPGSGGTLVASVTCDASDLGQGVYYGSVIVESDDPDTPLITVPVTFNVGAGVFGTLNGIVRDPLSNPVNGVSVHAEDGLGHVGNTNTSSNGSYIMSLSPGTYAVTYSLGGYLDTVIPGVVIVDGQTTTQDAIIEPDPNSVPTLSEWGMLLMGLMLMAAGSIAVIRRRRVIRI